MTTKGDAAPPYVNFDEQQPRRSTNRHTVAAFAVVAVLSAVFLLCQPEPFVPYLLSGARAKPLPLRVMPCSSWSGDPSSDGWSLVNGALRNGQLCMAVVEDAPMAMACENDDAPVGITKNSWNASLLPACSPPLITLKQGTGRVMGVTLFPAKSA